MNLKTAQHIFFAGIGGSGVSSLAGLLHKQGKKISGADKSASQNTHMLTEEGIEVRIGEVAINNSEQLPLKTELLIHSSAIPENNPYRITAHQRKIPQLAYHEALGQLTKKYETIAVCGTHGKTTVTAMLAVILKDLINPTVIVGAAITELDNKNYRNGGKSPHDKKRYLIIEACEYQNHFLNYTPAVIVITNIEYDHPDFFKTPKQYKQAFANFAKKLKTGGILVDSYQNPKLQKQLHLSIPGNHNVQNALAALAAAQKIYPNLNTAKAINQLNHFTGAANRFQQIATIDKTPIIADYAHHPTAIKATLAAARERFGHDAKILCIFQPHQYSRTAKFLQKFSTCFADATTVIIPNIYKVRDTAKDLSAITTEQLVAAITRHHPDIKNGHGLKKTYELLISKAKNYDAVLIMGAGDISSLVDIVRVAYKL